jgi:AcrR family transcriptional regulator
MAAKRARAAPDRPAPGVGDRILATATGLFYREGVRAVGIQRVIDEAGIAKASLYAHYRSKDDLVAACISRRSEIARAAIERRLADAGPDARARLLAMFDGQVETVESEEFRGCPLLNASSEIAAADHPAKQVIAAQREWLRGLIASLVGEARLASADRLTGALIVLFDGSSATSLLDGDPTAARHARWAAERLLDAHAPARRPTRRSRRPARRT